MESSLKKKNEELNDLIISEENNDDDNAGKDHDILGKLNSSQRQEDDRQISNDLM